MLILEFCLGHLTKYCKQQQREYRVPGAGQPTLSQWQTFILPSYYRDPEPKPQSALICGPTPGACVLWWLVSDSQPNCEFWSWLFNLLYISQVTFIIPFTDGNLKISDWVLSALICMAQICFYAWNNSFFIWDSWSGEWREASSCQGEDLLEENAHVIIKQFSNLFLASEFYCSSPLSQQH